MRPLDRQLHQARQKAGKQRQNADKSGDTAQSDRVGSEELTEVISRRLGAAQEQTIPVETKVGAEASREVAAEALGLAEEARQIAAASLQASSEQIETIKQLQGAIGQLERDFEEMRQELNRLPQSLESPRD